MLKVILEFLLCISVSVDPAVLVNMHCGFISSQILCSEAGIVLRGHVHLKIEAL